MSKFDPKAEERKRAQFYERTAIPGGNYDHKRGKITPRPAAAWGTRGGDGQEHDADRGKNVLDEALGD